MTANIEHLLPKAISSETADWYTKTHVSKIYRYSNLALKSIVPADFIEADTPEKRRQMLNKELEIGKIYNAGDPDNIFKGIITKIDEDGNSEPFLVMEWLPIETRLDSLLRNNRVSEDQLKTVVRQMVNAHTSIHATGEEQNFYSTKNFPARFAVNLELAQSGIRKLLNNDLQHIVEIFEKLQGRMVNEIPMGFLEKRISNGFVKFSHADTKTDNIYIHNNKVIFLDAVVIKPMWQCTDRIEELAALVISSLEESNDNLVSAAMNAYRPLDKDLTNQTIKFFWMLCANWSFVRGIVSLLHAIVKKKDGFSVEDHLNKARPRFETAIKFAETALSPLPSFHFE